MFATVTTAWATAAEPVNMQQFCDNVLPAGMNEYKAESACAIVVSVPDGRVLATAECATEGAVAPLRLNESTRTDMLIQPFVLLSALESGKLSVNSMVTCTPLQVNADLQLTDHPFCYGMLTGGQVIKKSSVAGTGRMIVITGAKQIATQFAALGLKQQVADNIPELASLVTDFTATPMELAAAYTAIGRGGKFAPLTVDGEPAQPGETAMKPTTATAMLQVLESCTEKRGAAGRGVAHAAAMPGYRVACKTSNIRSQADKRVKEVGAVLMLPADKPQLLVLVLLKNGDFINASTSAVSLAKQIAEQGIKQFNIAPAK